MFAGPNGSGKSTIKSLLAPELLGFYINPDELQKAIEDSGAIDLAEFGIGTPSTDPRAFYSASPLIHRAGLQSAVETLQLLDRRLIFSSTPHDASAYLASVTADFIRTELISQKQSFTFETVMSSPDKVELLRRAQNKGYRTYLYYIATQDPAINIARVRNRVEQGGHDVPVEKIVSRYWRSLDLLLPAMRAANRAYVFDNSGAELVWLAEGTDGQKLELKASQIPAWFRKAVLDRLQQDA